MASLMMTMTELKLADSLMPMTRMVVMTTTMAMAIRLKRPVAWASPAVVTPGGKDMSGSHCPL
jgi:hypothetical protein